MTQLTEEQQERVRQIRERQGYREEWAYGADIEFLLSLLDSDSQAATLSHCALCEDPHFLYRDCVLAAATAMRDKCVETIRGLRPEAAGAGAFKDAAIRALSSLTLDPQSPEKQK